MKKQCNRLISALLAFVMVFGMFVEVLPAVHAEEISDQENAVVSQQETAATAEEPAQQNQAQPLAEAPAVDPTLVPVGENLIQDSTFDGNVTLENATQGTHTAGRWYNWNLTGIQANIGRNGTSAVTLGVNKDTSVEQDVSGLKQGTTYRYTAWVKVEQNFSSGNKIEVGLKDVDTSTNLIIVNPDTNNHDWQQITFDFTYNLTGNLRVFVYTAGSNVQIHVDDVALYELAPKQQEALVVDGGFEACTNESIRLDGNNVDKEAGHWYKGWRNALQLVTDASKAHTGEKAVKLQAAVVNIW